MTEVDIPKRVVVVLMFLVILVSFLGALTVLQLFATSPGGYQEGMDKAALKPGQLPQVGKGLAPSAADDSATVSIRIQNYAG
jgi:hypothetical protein